MKFQGVIELTQKEKDYVNHLLTTIPKDENECFGEDEKFSKSLKFSSGYEVDIEICGVQYEDGSDNIPYTQGILYNECGGEVTFTEPMDEFCGEWDFEDGNGDEYVVIVK